MEAENQVSIQCLSTNNLVQSVMGMPPKQMEVEATLFISRVQVNNLWYLGKFGY